MALVRGTLFKYGLKAYDRLVTTRRTADVLQAGVLRKLLQKAAATQFGHYYEFERLLLDRDPIAAFQSTVPLHSYNQIHDQWWHKLFLGERDVCWPGKIQYFGLSSGTSGAPSKLIPVSNEMIKAMRRASTTVFRHSLRLRLPASFYGRQFLIIGGCAQLIEKDGLLMGDISGINASLLPAWFDRFYKPGKRIAGIRNWEERALEIAKQAPQWDVSTIGGIPSWMQLLLEYILQHNHLNSIHDIWPHLQVYVTGGIAFAPYRRRIEELLGKSIHYIDTYYTSEGNLAAQRHPATEVQPMQLFLHHDIFFEFIPFDDQHFDGDGNVLPQAKALDIQSVEEGKDYALVLSTCAGAWRYLIGDTVRFTNKKEAEIIITGRTGHFLSICGEHLSVDNMNQAIVHLQDRLGLEVPEFTVKAVKVDHHFEHHWFLGCKNLPTSHSVEEIADCLDTRLRQINDDYHTERSDNLLRRVRVFLLPLSVFFEWQARQGKMGGQHKFPRVMKDAAFAEWRAFVGM